MCGIAGIIVKPDRSLPDLEERLAAMAAAMRHRGPDDAGIMVSHDGRAGLANRRLAVRDLSSAGHMPMANDAGNVWITHNGEIYNTGELRHELERLGYAFRSRSDTEVILHGYEAWGKDVTRRLRGMFAFAILTLPQSRGGLPTLFLARDHLGVKPLCYAQTHDAFLFASELKGLLASGLVSREIDPAGLAGYLLLGSVPNPLTIYRGVAALEPATALQHTGEAATRVNYWSLPADTMIPPTAEASRRGEAVEQVRSLLAEAVRIRLVSDVPLGAFLSGGLDSSAVVLLMRETTDGPIRTCTMAFEEAAYSESAYALAVARAVGADHFERVITAPELLSEFDCVLDAMDQPTIDGVNSYFVSQTARQAGLTVALSGLGGDELFGGYPNTFRGVPQLLQALRIVRAVPGGKELARAALSAMPDRHGWVRVRDAVDRPASPSSAYLARRGLFAPREVRELLAPQIWAEACQLFDPVAHITARAGETLVAGGSMPTMSWVSRAELGTYTHHQLLRDTDVMSMAHSLEVREPLLDVRLVELLLRLPDDVKRDRTGYSKPLLRRAIGDRLPALVRERRDKRGFTFPFAPWLKGPLRARAAAITADVEARGWLRPGAARVVLDDYAAGKVHWSRPWSLVALGSIR